ncbi:MAG: hypothetical protein QOK43_468 [Acidimicrobiaceae bacterium]|nr:hypothetical protein [Acidimicrobiaceae bacterium]
MTRRRGVDVAAVRLRMLVLVAVVVVAAAGGACKSNSSSTSKSTSSTDATVALPVTHPKPSTLQFRPVLGEAEDCPSRNTNPAPDKATSILHVNQCLSLGPSVLTIKKADVVAETTVNGPPVVRMTLRGDDVEALAALSRDYISKTVALVAFGRVLSTPKFQSPIVDGQFVVTSLTQNQAADLKVALS